MTCFDAHQMLAGRWSGELDRPGVALLDLHLENCAECRAEAALLGGMWDRLGDLPAAEPSRAQDIRWESTLESLMPQPASRSKGWKFWPAQPVWQGAVAFACLLIGVAVGLLWPGHRGSAGEIAELRQEVAATREMVTLSLLRQDSATDRLKGVDYSGRMKTLDPDVVTALVQAVSFDPSVNVRLAAIDALTKAAGDSQVKKSLAQSIPHQESPMVQAALIDYLIDARDRQAVGTLRQLTARPDLNPAVRQRARFALQQLSQ